METNVSDKSFIEEQRFEAVRKILPEKGADSVCPKGSRLAHLYGLPKTHKPQLSMRPILSATGTYNFLLAKWLDERLKPLSMNKFTIMDPLKFVEEVRGEKVDAEEILVSYDVTSLFTNVPVDETIKILVERAFKLKTYKLNLKKSDLETLLNLAVKHQLLQFDGNLYEQVDGVAMGSPLGPLLANTFIYLLLHEITLLILMIFS